jgi:PAN domain-containing protein
MWGGRLPRVPTSRSSCSIAAPAVTNFGRSRALANLLIAVPLCRSEIPDRIRRLWCGDFRSAVLACLRTLVLVAATTSHGPAQAQANFDRPGGDYLSLPIPSGDPAECALACERDRRCRAWSFNYPNETSHLALCWLKNSVPPRVADDCCVSGVRGAGVLELRNGAIETSIDRAGGDYRTFELKRGEGDEICKAACMADNKCRAWTYARSGYVGREPHCFLKKEIKPPRRRPGFISGVVR